MKVINLLETKNNVYYPNIHILRKYIQILNDYHNNPTTSILKKEHLDFCFSNDNDNGYSRVYDSNMIYLELFYYDTGEVIFKLNLKDFSIYTFFDDTDEKLIEEFLKSDFSINLEILKKRRIRQIKINKIK